jgi:hypothetical protein
LQPASMHDLRSAGRDSAVVARIGISLVVNAKT